MVPRPQCDIFIKRLEKIIKNILMIGLICFLPNYIQAQITEGIIKDHENRAIPYAHVYFQQSKVGTYSSDSGQFELQLQKLDKKDTLIISHVSFETLKIPYKNLEVFNSITLHSRKKELESIEVYSLTPIEIFIKIKKETSQALSEQKNKNYYEIYEASLNDQKAWEQLRLIEYTREDDIVNVRDSQIKLNSYDVELTNTMGSLSFSYGNLTDLYNSIYFNHLLFENLLNDEKIHLDFSNYRGSSRVDTLYIMEKSEKLGYLCYDIKTNLALELHFDLAKSESLQAKKLVFKSLFRIATKRKLKSIDKLEIYQQYHLLSNGKLIPKNLKMNFELMGKKRGVLEKFLYQKALYQKQLLNHKGEPLNMQLNIERN
ncbi:carboxypeptidase-like regulatory domain-containing protein [Marivirga tractuosa]|uniref:carboxypeptidase-like regulatory domain-containing protein n=1 Tax=Marivirga tractuosa TaxID=1006 RepID=UPI0030C82392